MSDNHEHPVRELAGLCEPMHIDSIPLSYSRYHSDSLLYIRVPYTLSEYLFVRLRQARVIVGTLAKFFTLL